MKTIIQKQDILTQLEQMMPKSFLSLWGDLKDFLEWNLTEEWVKNEVDRLLFDMETASSPASSYEIYKVEQETKAMLELLWI